MRWTRQPLVVSKPDQPSLPAHQCPHPDEADMPGLTRDSGFDPFATLAANFCCDAQSAPRPNVIASVQTEVCGGREVP